MLKYGVVVTVGLYASLLVSYPRFDLVDDHLIATTMRLGESPYFPLSAGVSTATGRFEPLDGQEYTVLGKFFKFTPRMCYAFNAAQLVLLVVISIVLLRDFVAPGPAYAAVGLMLVSPGFVKAWFRLYAGERGALFWAIASLCGVQLLGRSGHWRWLLAAVIAGNLALYYKEPVFAGIATFSALELVAALARRKWSRKNLAHAMLLASTAMFLVLYYVLIVRHQSGNYADQRRVVSTVENQIMNLRTFMLEGHPLIFLILLPDAIVAGLKAIRTRFAQTSTLDSLSISGLVYVGLITFLNLPPNFYYLLPAYAFGLAPIAKRLTSIPWGAISYVTWTVVIFAAMALCAIPLTWIYGPMEKYPIIGLIAAICIAVTSSAAGLYKNKMAEKAWAISAALAVVCVLGNQIPATVDELAVAKFGPWSFQRFLVELRIAVRSSDPRPVPVFFLDSPRGFYVECYRSIGEYLRLDCEVGRDFDMFSEVPAELTFVADAGSPYSVFRHATRTPINPGDLLVGHNVSQSQFEKWAGRGTVLYRSVRPNWLNTISLDSAVQGIKSRIKAGLGITDAVEPRTIDFCLLVARKSLLMEVSAK